MEDEENPTKELSLLLLLLLLRFPFYSPMNCSRRTRRGWKVDGDSPILPTMMGNHFRSLGTWWEGEGHLNPPPFSFAIPLLGCHRGRRGGGGGRESEGSHARHERRRRSGKKGGFSSFLVRSSSSFFGEWNVAVLSRFPSSLVTIRFLLCTYTVQCTTIWRLLLSSSCRGSLLVQVWNICVVGECSPLGQ